MRRSGMRRRTVKRQLAARRQSARLRGKRSAGRPARAGTPVVSVIIPAMNERRTIASVIRNAYRVHPRTEVIVVVNGSTDGTGRIAARTGARLIIHAEPLGHDVGRSIGAQAAGGEVLLFLDADMVIPAKELKPLVNAVAAGVDVALNRYEGPKERFDVHPVVLAKHALNIALKREDLGGASMTTIPHAISRRALTAIRPQTLSVPPKAQVIAVMSGLTVRAVHAINVGRRNPRKRKHKQGKDPLEALIVGDHLEALNQLTAMSGPRGRRQDHVRNRGAVR